MHSGDRWRLGHRPGLDGLRGVAILLVVGYHSTSDFTSAAGIVGVTTFFVLSGFLITSLLLEERDRTGRVRIGAFYLRRVRRLVPALTVFVAVVFAVQVSTGAVGFVTGGSLLAVLGYCGNWLQAFGHPIEAISHTWSLAVEEQFYLVWPLLLVAAARRAGERGVALVAVSGIMASVALRVGLHANGAEERVYYATDTSASALLAGCLLAVAVRRGLRVRRGALGAGLAGLVALSLISHDRFIVGPLAGAVLAVMVVAAVASRDGVRGLEARWLVAIGKRSYGLYLWHFPLLWYLGPRVAGPQAVVIATMLALAALLSVVSWRYVEEPFLRRGGSADLVHREGAFRYEHVLGGA